MAHRQLTLCGLLVMLLLVCNMDSGLVWGQEDGAGGSERKALVPAMFIFGDSLIDNGNNNNLASLAKANYFPYGIDFSGGSTGRFSNGYTIVDTIAELLGLPLVPPYSEVSGDQMRYGVNYASAAAGILDDTGRNFVGRIPFNQQIKNFENTLDQITGTLGVPDVSQSLSKSIFFIGMGSNDYLNNYLMPNYNTKFQYNAQQYADLLSQQYSQQISRLYNLGARKFVIAGLGLMGCIPSILAQSSNGICSEEVNQLVLPFNTNTKAMINNLSANLPGSRFSYIDIKNMFQYLLANAGTYGFSALNRGCCGIGRNRGQITCLPFQTPCPDRKQYIFWDAFHPTEAVNMLFGQRAFNGNTEFAYPINIQQLAGL
ncbi:GDSL esterase/lipase-like [Dorcoceras hygrometricum]|uniref:GDSL esterase/lipase-like n=1 Tax=Dorcoceras hygrometricum TaxID=472368 RepID=A0A2Z7BFR2_9LAMI|nr:GDSL esterase/lipase-like [Dorcoceras hygrometricum]